MRTILTKSHTATRSAIAAILIASVCMVTATQANTTIEIRLSYKIVLNPDDGTRPPGPGGGALTNQMIDDAIEGMNELQGTYFRGYRFIRVGSIMEVGGEGDLTGPSQWYDTNFFGEGGSDLKDEMQQEAQDNPSQYQWNSNAINMYLTAGICGGICSFPGDFDEIIIIGGCSADDGPLQQHEIGHFFDLCHTQGCPCGSCAPGSSGLCHTIPGNDEISDTPPDLQCWDQDDIAQWTYNLDYNQLTTSQRNFVDDSFMNVMSYHTSEIRLTEIQLDVWADIANDERRFSLNGDSIFVEPGGGNGGNGSSTSEYRNINTAVANATSDGTDIIMFRPGTYNQTLTITRAVTLRGTRGGVVRIGTGSASPTPDPPVIYPYPDIYDGVPGFGSDPSATLGYAGDPVAFESFNLPSDSFNGLPESFNQPSENGSAK